MTGSSKEHKLGNVTISLMFSDQIIGVGIDEIETWTSTPMTQKATFDMLCFKRLGEKSVLLQEYLCRGKIIGDPLEGKETLHIKAFFRRLELFHLVIEVD